MKKLIAALSPKGRLSRGIVAITAGSSVAQLIVLISSPIVTRFFSPEEFGILAVYSGLLGIATVVASMRYQLAIVLPRTDGAAAAVLVLALATLSVTVLLAGLLVAWLGDSIGRWTNAPQLVPYLWLLPVGIGLAGAYQVFNYWAIRQQAFPRIARTKIQQSIGMVSVQIASGAIGTGPAGLLAGQIVGQAAGLVSLAGNAFRHHRHLLSRVTAARVWQKARRYRGFPLFLSPAGLLNKLGSELPLILFSALFSPAVAGLYLLAHRFTKRPAGLISQSFRQVFLSGAAEAHRAGRLSGITAKALGGLTRIGLAPLVLFGVVAPELFALLFGPDWTEAGRYAQWLVPTLVAAFIVSPLTTLNVVLERQRFGLFFQASLLTAKLGGILVGASLGGPLLTVACYSISSAIAYAIFGTWIARLSGVSYAGILGPMGRELSVVLPIALLLWALSPAHDGTWLSIAALSQWAFGAVFLVVAGTTVLWRWAPFVLNRRQSA